MSMRAAPAHVAPAQPAPAPVRHGRSAARHAEPARPPAAYRPAPAAAAESAAGRVLRYHRELGQDRRALVGYVMDLGYDWGTVITNDYYKVRVGGLPKNSFLLIRPGSLTDLIRPEDYEAEVEGTDPPVEAGGGGAGFGAESLFDLIARPRRAADRPGGRDQPAHLILARVLEPAATPLAQDVARTYFELRKSHAPEIDLFTRGELQWGAMKVAVLGTFYDDPDADLSGLDPAGSSGILFGGDVQNFLSPHLYTVHVPGPRMLQDLINAFVGTGARRRIGHLRLTESLPGGAAAAGPPVGVFVSPADFIGSRTALFGKTRTGKSNTVKVIAQMVLDAARDGGAKVGQIVFDLNGEYAYRNAQDRTCLYDLYSDRCVRYSLRPRPPEGVRPLKADFYGDVKLGHRIIRELLRQQDGTPPDYMKGFLEWEPLSVEEQRTLEREEPDAAARSARQEGIYRCILHEAGFEHSAAARVPVRLLLNKEVRADLATRLQGLAKSEDDGTERIPPALPLESAGAAYQTLWAGYDPTLPLFRTRSGREYLDETAKSMLTILAKCRAGGGGAVSGYSKLVPLRRYHARDAGRLVDEIADAVDACRTVIIDLSNAAEELATFFGQMVSSAVFSRQMEKFTADRLGDHFVQFYFEEAHNLFPRDDRDLRGIYNRLAKEGAKLHIGLVYATQSIESLSPDLLKNTENFFVAHLNDDREIKALTRFHEFRDVGADVQRAKTQGFVRMITKSHRFALPVQIRRFAETAEAPGRTGDERS